MVTRRKIQDGPARYRVHKPLEVYVIRGKKSYRVLTFAGKLVSISTAGTGININPESPLGKSVGEEALSRLKQG